MKSSLYQKLKKTPLLISLFLTPFYLFRFLYYAVIHKSLQCLRYYPGHFASPIPSLKEIRNNKHSLFSKKNKELGGIDLNLTAQKELLKKLVEYYSEFDPPAVKASSYRYYHNNSMFGFNDALTLFTMLRHFKPKKIIEIGSGYSSALFVDINEKYFANNSTLTCIEPYPETLKNTLNKSDFENVRLIDKKIQDVPLEAFKELNENDILFIDTSHVLKIGSDLSTIFFDILPVLNNKAIIHIHDIFWPFEYPESTITTGRIWNENYFLRAFLQFNQNYKILYFNSFMENNFSETYKQALPKCCGSNGSSIWIQKSI